MPVTTSGTETPSHHRRTLRYTRPLRRPLTVSAVLAVVFVSYTWLVVHWGPFIRIDHAMDRNWHVSAWWPLLTRLDRIGQRAVCLPILAAVVAVTAWRHRSWRPVLLAGIGVFTVNLAVLIAKTAMARGRPLTGHGFFTGGEMYPSGHTANVVVVYGLCFHLITHYWTVSQRVKRVLFWLLGVLCVIMFTTSLLLRWHWFSDLIGGFLVGGSVLALTVGIDAAVPFASRRLVVVPAEEVSVRDGQADGVPGDSAAGAPTAPGSRAEHPAGDLSGHPAGERQSVTLRRTADDLPSVAADRRSRR